jgi:hypothetical protein
MSFRDWKPTVENTLGGLAAAAICWAVALAAGALSGSDSVIAFIDVLTIENPFTPGNMAQTDGLKAYLKESFGIENSQRIVNSVSRSPTFDVAVLTIRNTSNIRSKQIEVSFANGVIIASKTKQMVDAGSSLTVDAIDGRDQIRAYLVSANPRPGDPKAIKISVDGKRIDYSLSRLPDAMDDFAGLIYDDAWTILFLAIIGIIAVLYVVGKACIRVFKAIKGRYGTPGSPQLNSPIV